MFLRSSWLALAVGVVAAAANPGASAEYYTYDGAGNRLSSASGGYQYDATGRLTAGEGYTFTYDNNGNMVSRAGANGTTTYAYDFENRLTAVHFPDGNSASYEYDALGRRIQKSVSGAVTNYLYDGAEIQSEMNASGAMQARYTHGAGVDQMLTMERGGQTYFYQSNAIGSVVMLTGSSGNPACSYTYDSFGRTQACSGVTNPFAYAGREYDAESGMYYMRARYYDPVTARFASIDPLNLTGRVIVVQYGGVGVLGVQGLPQQLNSYSYAANNPLVYRDPSGQNCVELKNFHSDGNYWTATAGGSLFIYLNNANGSSTLFATAPASYTFGQTNNSVWAIVSPSGQLYQYGATVDYSQVSPQQKNDLELKTTGQLGTLIANLQSNASGNNNQSQVFWADQAQAANQLATGLQSFWWTGPIQTFESNWNEAFGNGGN